MTMRWIWLLALFGSACGDVGKPPEPDLAQAMMDLGQPADDLSVLADASAPDLAEPDDLSPPPDLAPIIVPPAAVWWSTGGASSAGATLSGNFSVGVNWVAGRSVATSTAVLTFGYFTSSNQ